MKIKEFLKIVYQCQEQFSNKEKKLVDYVLANLEKVVDMSIDELLNNANCGYSTIYSLFHKMGFDGYRDFIISLCKELNYGNFNNLPVNNNLTKFVTSEYLSLISRINNLLDEKELLAAAKLINNSKELYILGINEDKISAYYASNRFLSLGKKTLELSSIESILFNQLSFAQVNDSLLIINSFPNKELIIECLHKAIKLKMKIIFLGVNSSKELQEKINFIFPLSAVATGFSWKKSATFLDSFFIIDNLVKLVHNELK